MAQQLLALCLQESRVGERLWTEWLPLPTLMESSLPITNYLIEQGFVDREDGMLFIGPQAERKFGHRHFMGLMATVTAPPVPLAPGLWGSTAIWRGAWVDLGGPGAGPAPVIRAEVIAALLLGGVKAEPGAAAGIRLRGSTVTGSLELTGTTVPWPLICEGCQFDTGVSLVDSSVRTVRITDSELPAFDGTRLRLDGILDLSGSRIAGHVRLEHAKVSGQLRMRASRTDAIAAAGLSIDGDADCSRMEAHGLVTFQAAAIAGTLDLTGARIASPGRRALVLSYAAIGGKLECRDLAVDGETRAARCRITAQLDMSGARLDNPAGVAFFAGGLDVGGGAFFADGFRARGAFRLIGAHLAANLTIEGSTFDHPGGVAVNLERSVIGGVLGDGLTCHGQLSMTGARVSGDVSLASAVLESGAGTCALNAERAQVDGALILRQVTALGEVNLRSIRVGERILLQQATLSNPSGTACRLSRAQASSDVFCDQLTADGRLRLAGAVVGAAITLDRVTLANAGGSAVDAKGLQVRELIGRPAVLIDGEVDLRNAAIGVFRDDPETWPDKPRLDGLTYQALEPLLTAGQRLQWLSRDPNGYQPQPYEQLAAHYSSLGQPAQGRSVLYARERIQRQGKGLAASAWSVLQDITVGYGYRPRRALGWIGLLLITGSIVFSIAPPPALQAGAAPHFNGIIYTLDLLLPVVSLGQKYAFQSWRSGTVAVVLPHRCRMDASHYCRRRRSPRPAARLAGRPTAAPQAAITPAAATAPAAPRTRSRSDLRRFPDTLMSPVFAAAPARA